ncbi:MAG: NADH-quinone oxidoreductase subunit D 1 [Acidimicrobiia bacterium]|nr:NADH-quinone oxidoreductase subunit D 1 [Acidimicrobiia bacterium]
MTQLDSRGIVEVSDGGVSVELKGEAMTLNIGPQHPSTHGVLRLVAEVDGERISKLDPAIGYMHRGKEKLSEVRTYPQITALINRIDWVSGFANEVAFIRAVEKLTGIEPTERAQMIRLILTELTRISNHLVFASSYPLELGAATPLMWAFREREHIMDVIESVTGGRFHPNFNRVGGVKPAAGGGKTQKKVSLDLPSGFYASVENAMDKAELACDELDELVTGNEMIQIRTKDVGIISYEDAVAYGISGPNARASGVPTDLRKLEPDVLPYAGLDFDVITRENGDSFDRYLVRIAEIRESIKIVRQAVNSVPAGPLQAKVPRVLKVPAGSIYVRAENPKGEMGYYIVSQGGRVPYRVKIRSASFSNISIMSKVAVGQLIPDLVATMGSLDFVLGDVDR